jgi:hypothetical protein
MPHPKCMFCGERNKPSREDVLPRWAARAVSGNATGKLQVWRKAGSVAADFRTVAKRNIGEATFGFLTYGACEPCNNGWMNEIEKAARKVIEPMIRGHRTTLDSEAQSLIARWMLKTTLMFEHGLFHTYGKHRYRQQR